LKPETFFDKGKKPNIPCGLQDLHNIEAEDISSKAYNDHHAINYYSPKINSV